MLGLSNKLTKNIATTREVEVSQESNISAFNEDPIVTENSGTNVVNGGSLTSMAIFAGVIIYELFSAISVASGRLIAYIA